MSEKIKLIIEIPKWKYKSICEGVEASKRCGVIGIDPDIHEAIYNGTPLNDVKAEIQAKEMVETDIEKQFYNMALGDVIEILNNIGKESEGV